jgi:phytoene/squalene synthetase
LPAIPVIKKGEQVNQMITNLASSITKAASKQTYYTIRYLVDRDKVEDAYRAYAYFRWVDDVLDAELGSGPALKYGEPSERMMFLERQKSLLESCYRGESPRDVDIQENMLVELVHHDQEKNNLLRQAQENGLQSYLRNMMLVMDFDARRRGRVISLVELNEYTRWLAIAVTDNLQHFVGNSDYAPKDETRYLAVSAAHIIHMLRDTYVDMQAGYFNIPCDVLDANSIGPRDVHSDGYRAWVKGRVEQAREYFEAGKSYFARVQNLRHRLAGLAYISRFEWLLATIEREGYCLRPEYSERKSVGTGLHMGWQTLSSMINLSGAGALPQPAVVHPLGKS